ncbi:hypothetical protein [Pseudorhizobium flavum]|uniref:hypothetical protein n=1 Tax=Pseudorhizobium flavum TaxID=1335061 RepID=UPI00376FFC69
MLQAVVDISGPVMLVLNAMGPARNGICRGDIKLTTGLASESLYPILIQLELAGWLLREWDDANPSARKQPKRRLYVTSDAGRLKMKQILVYLLQYAE